MVRYFFFLVSLLNLVTPITSYASGCPQSHCLAVVDAGSTGSRLHVYAYDLDETNTPVHITSLVNKKVTPGLASLDSSQASLDNYLNSLFKDSNLGPLPLYFYATAGMRLLSPNKQRQYYQGVSNWFSRQGQWQLLGVKTISGKEEAIYDWLAVNYFLDKLNTQEPVGVMDMGGASVQIAFPIKKDTPIEDNDRATLSLYGKTKTLAVHSFLGLGQTEMSHQFLNKPACFAQNYPLPDGTMGRGEISTCRTAVQTLVNGVQEVNQSIQPLLAANPVKNWVAIGGIVNLVETRPLQFRETLTVDSLLEQSDKAFCSTSWDILDKDFPNNDYASLYCLASAYYASLLVDGYGLSANQVVNYVPSRFNIDWTLGVVFQP